MDWQEEYKKKLVTAEEAASIVKSGDRVAFPLDNSGGPMVIPEALAARLGELKDVEIEVCFPPTDFGWFQPGWEESFKVIVNSFVAPVVRPMMDERRADYNPRLYSLWGKAHDEGRPGIRGTDVVMTAVSPPDRDGFCSFGGDIWSKKWYVKTAKKVIVEVNKNHIRTYGDNSLHVSEIDYFVEYTPPQLELTDELKEELLSKAAPGVRELVEPVIPKMAKSRRVAIVEYLASSDLETTKRFFWVVGFTEPPAEVAAIAHNVSQLVKDGDTFGIGYSSIGGTLCGQGIFDDKHDLGYYAENLVRGVVQLVKDGVVTGKRKTFHPGKVVCNNFYTGDPEELTFVADNPMFELYPQDYVVNIRNVAANDNMVAINAALSVDLTGQIASESIGPRMYTGSGGQPSIAIGAMLSKGGRSITMLRSTSNDDKISRITPFLDPGTIVTVPRNFADYIVTEYGIASLFGKTQRERTQELIAIARPDFRAELKKQAQKLFWP